MAVVNTLAYYDTAKITAVKSLQYRLQEQKKLQGLKLKSYFKACQAFAGKARYEKEPTHSRTLEGNHLRKLHPYSKNIILAQSSIEYNLTWFDKMSS